MTRRLLIEAPAWVAVAGAAAVLLTQVVDSPFTVVAVLQAMTPIAVPVLVGLAVGAMVTGRNAIAFSAAVVGVGYLAALAPVVFAGSGPEPDADGQPITIVASNLLFSNEGIEQVVDTLAALDADLLALSEVTPDIARELGASRIASAYPHRIELTKPGAGGMVLWSRLPLGQREPVPAFGRAIDTTVLTAEGAIRILVVHLPPPVFDGDAWRQELGEIGEIARQSLFPTVVLGDFNATPFHPPYRRMVTDADLHDALADVGRSLAPTWPTDTWLPPFASLDHILLDSGLATIDADTVSVPGSDHRAVTATIAFAEPA